MLGGSEETGAGKASQSLLSQSEIASGLKEALTQGAQQAVDLLGKEDGFFKNTKLRIPMPDYLSTIGKALRAVGQEKLADEFVLTLNRAAEAAVPETLKILKTGIRQMTFEDAKNILNGPDNAATQYLRKVGGKQMHDRIIPVVQQATSRAGVTNSYKQLIDSAGFAAGLVDLKQYDLDEYVTGKTIDGLFVLIAEEEARIRRDPIARGTKLLKKVFGASG